MNKLSKDRILKKCMKARNICYSYDGGIGTHGVILDSNKSLESLTHLLESELNDKSIFVINILKENNII